MKKWSLGLALLFAFALLVASAVDLDWHSQIGEADDLGDNQFKDERDGQTYPFIAFGNLKWMGRNLSFESPESECYDLLEENCEAFGRMYNFPESRTVCPEGWRLPLPNEWKALKKAIGSGKADRWITGNWTDPAFAKANNESGLSILPGGRKDENGSYQREGKFGEKGVSSSFWLDDEEYHWHVRWGKSHIHKHGPIAEQGRKFYVRCVCETE